MYICEYTPCTRCCCPCALIGLIVKRHRPSRHMCTSRDGRYAQTGFARLVPVWPITTRCENVVRLVQCSMYSVQAMKPPLADVLDANAHKKSQLWHVSHNIKKTLRYRTPPAHVMCIGSSMCRCVCVRVCENGDLLGKQNYTIGPNKR